MVRWLSPPTRRAAYRICAAGLHGRPRRPADVRRGRGHVAFVPGRGIGVELAAGFALAESRRAPPRRRSSCSRSRSRSRCRSTRSHSRRRVLVVVAVGALILLERWCAKQQSRRAHRTLGGGAICDRGGRRRRAWRPQLRHCRGRLGCALLHHAATRWGRHSPRIAHIARRWRHKGRIRRGGARRAQRATRLRRGQGRDPRFGGRLCCAVCVVRSAQRRLPVRRIGREYCGRVYSHTELAQCLQRGPEHRVPLQSASVILGRRVRPRRAPANLAH